MRHQYILLALIYVMHMNSAASQYHKPIISRSNNHEGQLHLPTQPSVTFLNQVGTSSAFPDDVYHSNIPLDKEKESKLLRLLTYISNFTVDALPDAITLTWYSKNSGEISRYDVLKYSPDAPQPEIIQTFVNTGSHFPDQYQVRDPSASSRNAYQLRLYDQQGNTVLTEIETCAFESLDKILIYPKLIRSEVMITHIPSRSNITVKLADLQGRIHLNQSVPERQTSLNISNLPTGSYLLTIESGNEKISEWIHKV